MRLISRILIALIAVGLFVDQHHVVFGEGQSSDIAHWGKFTDPDGDCKIFVSDGALLISVPGTNRPHDLAADVAVVNSPRVLQNVEGEFTLQVQVDGRFTPGDVSSLPGRGSYNGAGVVLMRDENNVVTLARAVLHHAGSEPRAYANFEIRIDGRLERIGMVDDLVIPPNGPLYLRLEQRGRKILGAVSTDGLKWTSLEAKEIPEAWGSKLQTGFVAISTSKEEFNPRFSKLQMLK